MTTSQPSFVRSCVLAPPSMTACMHRFIASSIPFLPPLFPLQYTFHTKSDHRRVHGRPPQAHLNRKSASTFTTSPVGTRAKGEARLQSGRGVVRSLPRCLQPSQSVSQSVSQSENGEINAQPAFVVFPFSSLPSRVLFFGCGVRCALGARALHVVVFERMREGGKGRGQTNGPG